MTITRRAPTWFVDLFRLRRWEYYADFFITGPLTAVFAWLSFRGGLTSSWVLMLLGGFGVWTLYEYALHRWVLHESIWMRSVHWLHHRHPMTYVGVHPGFTLLLYVTLWLLFGLHASAGMVGFSVGYWVYSVMHTLFHYGKSTGVPSKLKMHHITHHTVHAVNFGVTTTVWDHVFRTYRHSP